MKEPSASSGNPPYTYDESGRVKTVLDGATNKQTSYTYNVLGLLTNITYGNGLVETRQYNSLNQLEFIETKQGTSVVSSFRYTRDAIGNVLKFEENTGRVVEYGYDKGYRLIREDIKTNGVASDRTIIYTYDAVGNRLSRNDSQEGITTYTYDKADRLKTSTLNNVTTTYIYDASGNLTRKEVDATHWTNYQWSREGFLIRVQGQDGNVQNDIQYRYNDQGDRVAQIVNGVETRYLVDINRELSQVREEYSPNGTLQAAYTYTLEQLPVSQTRNGQVSYYLGDNLASARLLTNSTGTITDRYQYDAYGRIISQTGTTANSYGYTGEQASPLTGLVYLRDRYLDTDTGRFISVDPFAGVQQDPTSQHDYLYAHANPVVNRDPSGNYTLTEFSAAQVISDILRKTDDSAKIWKIYELEGRIKALEQVLWVVAVAKDLFANYLEGWGLGWVNRVGFSGANAPIATKFYQWDRPKTGVTPADEGFKKVQFAISTTYSIPPQSTFQQQRGFLDEYGQTGFVSILPRITGFFAVENNDTGTVPSGLAYSGAKWKVDFGFNPFMLGGSFSRELTLLQDKVTDGKIYKLVFGGELSARARQNPGGRANLLGGLPLDADGSFTIGSYVQLGLLGENLKIKWSPLFLTFSSNKGIELRFFSEDVADPNRLP